MTVNGVWAVIDGGDRVVTLRNNQPTGRFLNIPEEDWLPEYANSRQIRDQEWFDNNYREEYIPFPMSRKVREAFLKSEEVLVIPHSSPYATTPYHLWFNEGIQDILPVPERLTELLDRKPSFRDLWEATTRETAMQKLRGEWN